MCGRQSQDEIHCAPARRTSKYWKHGIGLARATDQICEGLWPTIQRPYLSYVPYVSWEGVQYFKPVQAMNHHTHFFKILIKFVVWVYKVHSSFLAPATG